MHAELLKSTGKDYMDMEPSSKGAQYHVDFEVGERPDKVYMTSEI